MLEYLEPFNCVQTNLLCPFENKIQQTIDLQIIYI